jgi:hypothetical protein
MAKKPPHSKHQTQWAAQFAVASELCKRGYEVALTMGNHPVSDIMAVSPKERVSFVVDVKGLHKKNFWPVRERPKTHDNLFYVFALVPSETKNPNRFFILTHTQVNEGIRKDWEGAKARRKAKGRSGEPADRKGVTWNFAEDYGDQWEALPK